MRARLFSLSLASLASSSLLFAVAPAFAQAPPPAAVAPVAPPPAPGVAVAAPPVTAPAPLPPAVPVLAPPASPSDAHLDLATLRALRDRAQITEVEYDTALREMNEGAGSSVAAEAPTFALGGFTTTIYGRAKADFIYDTTESYSDLAGNSLIARPAGAPLPQPPAAQTTYAGQNPRMQFSIRDSRFGFYIRAPQKWGIRVSALAEMDFFGQVASNATEVQNWSTGMVPRLRHFYFRIDNPVIDILVGQYWHLFGWQNVYHPASVQAQGLLGEVFSRDVQLRLSKKIASPWLSVEFAGAVLRPPQRDSGKPQGEAGVRFTLNKWTGLVTNGASGTSIQPLSVAVTGNFRDVTVPVLSPTPQASVDLFMPSIAVDGYLPIIPATPDRKDNALSVHGELVSGKGSADLYSAFTGGITFPTLKPSGVQGVNYPQNIDNGLVSFDSAHDPNSPASGGLHAIEWTTYLVGAQYYFPFTHGRLFLVGNYSHIESNNIASFTQHTAPSPSTFSFPWDRAVIQSGELYDGDLFVDVMTGVRFGIEATLTKQHYVDGTNAQNIRAQLGGMFSF